MSWGRLRRRGTRDSGTGTREGGVDDRGRLEVAFAVRGMQDVRASLAPILVTSPESRVPSPESRVPSPVLRVLPLLAALTACAETPAAERARTASRSAAPRPVVLDEARLDAVYARAAALPRLRSLLVLQGDSLRRERYFHGARAEQPANVKSASKSIVSALVGIAIARGHIRLDQTVGELLPSETRGLDSAHRAITVEDLLTMRTGLQTTSFDQYGAFVSSRNWVRHALTRPVVAARGEGGPMIYSTGSTHILSAALTRATRQTTWAFARRELAPLGIRLRPWTTDPQGVFFGGNEMRLTPREMLAFGRLYLDGGRAPDGTRVLPRAWIDSSWVARTSSGWSGHAYGYGWWMRDAHGHRVYFAWGYGGQFVFVIPSASMVVVATSDPEPAQRERGHLDAVHSLVDELLRD
jgi:CubicO group peptidase (beta-lactamase class C family)